MSRLICLCNKVSNKDVSRVLSKYPQAGLQDIINLTAASTSCGRCRIELEHIVKQIKENNKSAPSGQLSIPSD
jgi:bacterioferritin-associated ferredoxin